MIQSSLDKELLAIQRERNKLEIREKALLMQYKRPALDRIVEMMQTAKISLSDLSAALKKASNVGSKQSSRAAKADKKPTKKVPPKFRHPDDPGLVWSGRGKTPVWLRELEKQGRAEKARVKSK